ncbi:hypothetical protein ACWCPM_19730 [Streptomyces sp. NPDC002309]
MSASASPVYEVHYTWSPFQLLSGAWAKRLVAFRVDDQGVTLGGAPARHEKQTAFVPWRDIAAVVVWQQKTADLKHMNYIGLRRRAGAPDLPGPNASLAREQTGRLAPHIDHELFRASRHINLWTLDRERLVNAVRAFAPHVPIEDAD